MKLLIHYSVTGFSNTYVLSAEKSNEAVIIDPGIMNVELLRLVENNGLNIKHILITHSHQSHIDGIKTLLKVYNADIYAADPKIYDMPVNRLEDGQIISLADMEFEAISIPGHSSDSLVYRTGNMLFTGDTLGTGTIGKTPNSYARALLKTAIESRLLPFGNSMTFPGHGPPSSIRAEIDFNPYLSALVAE